MKTHLKGFGLENFRVFKDYTWFDFAPITILTGPNSSGKSSLNKALLLMKDNFEKHKLPPSYKQLAEGFSSNNYNDLLGANRLGNIEPENDFHQSFEPSSIEFNGKVHGLNDPAGTKNRFSTSNIMSFTIPYNIIVFREDKQDKPESSLQIDIINPTSSNKKKPSELSPIIQSYSDHLTFDDIFNETSEEIVKYHLSFELERKTFRTKSIIEVKTKTDVIILKITDHEVYFDVKLFNSLFLSNQLKINDDFDYSPKLEVTYAEANLVFWFNKKKVGLERSRHLANQVFSELNLSVESKKIIPDSIKVQFMGLDYLATSRNLQQRIYTDNDNSEFKSTLVSLYQAKNEGLDFKSFFDECSKIFGIEGTFDFEYDPEKGIYFPNFIGQNFINIGFGLNQIASIIFKIAEHISKKYTINIMGSNYFNNVSTILILEEPECNLHPKYQSKLADLVIQASNSFNIQFIIETHSEYLIRKMQYLTAKQKIKTEDTVIYYFHDPNEVPAGEGQVKKIQILEDGSLSDDFGTGFFDEAANLELELIRLKNIKNRNN